MAVLDLVTGLPITSSDALGRETTFEYDAGGRQTSVTGPDGLETTTSYTAASGTAPSTRTDTTPDGRVVRRTYDALGRHARVTDNVSGQAFTSSATARQLAAITYKVDGTEMTAVDQQGRTTTSQMDVLGRQVRSTVDKTGIAHETAYDDVAHTTTRTVDPAGSAAVSMTRLTSYDDGNRQVSELQSYLDPGAPASQQYSDPLESMRVRRARAANVEDGLGPALGDALRRPRRLLADADRHPQGHGCVPRPGGRPVAHRHPRGPADEQRAQRGRRVGGAGADLTYDAVGRQQTSTDPLGRTTTWTYHDDGDVATRTSELGTVITDTYDDTTGRLLSVEANPVAGSDVDPDVHLRPRGTACGAGRVATVTDEAGLKVSLAYDADGHVVKRSYSDGTSTSATYSDNGLVATMTDVTGAVTTYTYDSAGRMQTVTQRRGSAVLATVTYTYDGMSRVLTTTRGNGTTTTNTYTGRNQIATQTTTTGTGAPVESHAYTYDTHGNVASRTDTTPTAAACTTTPCPAPTTAGTWTTTYGYDAYDRLLSSATYAGPLQNPAPTPTTATSYTLDVDGDVVGTTTTTRRTVGGRPLVTTSRVTNTIDDAGAAHRTDHRQRRAGAAGLRRRRPPDAVADRCGADVRRPRPGDDRDRRRRDDELRLLAGRQPPAGHHHGVERRWWKQRGPDDADVPLRARRHVGQRLGRRQHDGRDHHRHRVVPAHRGPGGPHAASRHHRDRLAAHGRPRTDDDRCGGRLCAPRPALVGHRAGRLPRRRDERLRVRRLRCARAARRRPAPLPAAQSGGRANPFTYTGAVTASSMTDALTGHLLLPARSYDPAQARFTSRDSANVFNRYQGFSTNPIGLVDLSGRISQTDIIIDVSVLAVLVLVAVITGGAAAIAIPAVVGAMAVGAAVATSAVVGAVATGVGVAAAALGQPWPPPTSPTTRR